MDVIDVGMGCGVYFYDIDMVVFVDCYVMFVDFVRFGCGVVCVVGVDVV